MLIDNTAGRVSKNYDCLLVLLLPRADFCNKTKRFKARSVAFIINFGIYALVYELDSCPWLYQRSLFIGKLQG